MEQELNFTSIMIKELYKDQPKCDNNSKFKLLRFILA